ncbi:hypothetical protein GGX14DRAFT_405267 [Mycena pura]|uniref:Uncharacterized protein n=1 Tax=Mycena pura TaxID=153505 RepID=A0AAD6UU65_9AGAR|nr:hypothetical protein GGX14DRAFT_405267 [Mycena pura]
MRRIGWMPCARQERISEKWSENGSEENVPLARFSGRNVDGGTRKPWFLSGLKRTRRRRNKQTNGQAEFRKSVAGVELFVEVKRSAAGVELEKVGVQWCDEYPLAAYGRLHPTLFVFNVPVSVCRGCEDAGERGLCTCEDPRIERKERWARDGRTNEKLFGPKCHNKLESGNAHFINREEKRRPHAENKILFAQAATRPQMWHEEGAAKPHPSGPAVVNPARRLWHLGGWPLSTARLACASCLTTARQARAPLLTTAGLARTPPLSMARAPPLTKTRLARASPLTGPRTAFDKGQAGLCVTFDIGKAWLHVAFDIGKAGPCTAFDKSEASPANTFVTGEAGPRVAFVNGEAWPHVAFDNGKAWPRVAFDIGKAGLPITFVTGEAGCL